MSNSGRTPPQFRRSGSSQWNDRVSPLVYEGSGPLDSDVASSVADLVSKASRQGKAKAGFEAPPRIAGWAWNDLLPSSHGGVSIAILLEDGKADMDNLLRGFCAALPLRFRAEAEAQRRAASAYRCDFMAVLALRKTLTRPDEVWAGEGHWFYPPFGDHELSATSAEV